MLTLGIDDAGRGPVIGPMILAGVLIDAEMEKKLKKHKVRDSKIVAHFERLKLCQLIKETSIKNLALISPPEEVDNFVEGDDNLNVLEAVKTAEIINSINSGKTRKNKVKVIVDCPSNNARTWRNLLLNKIEHLENLEVVCEHKADSNYIAVAAASILAKCVREDEVAKIKSKYGEIGSGYAADPITQEFLRKNGARLRDSGIFRKSWSTWKKLFPARGQATLGDF